MIFTLLTFLAALSTAAVAEWFSIVGIISIYAGAPYHAGLVLGVVLGFAKLVNASWLYRNWDAASWKIKGPLIYFLLALMAATSMGVFGFLTKSHLEQGAATIDNSAKVERIEQQIAREKSIISDDEKVIAQLDSAINSYIGKDRTDKAVSIRKSQAPQRRQLREDIDVSQKKIDSLSEDKLKLTSEVRALQHEIGPIRYIAELFYGTGGDQATNVESAVKMFTLLIVSTLDPLAIILLIAANHQLLRLQDEKKEKAGKTKSISEARIIVSQAESDKEVTEASDVIGQADSNIISKDDGTIHTELNEPRVPSEMDDALSGKVLEETKRRHVDTINLEPSSKPIAKKETTMATYTWPTIPWVPKSQTKISSPDSAAMEQTSSPENIAATATTELESTTMVEIQNTERQHSLENSAVIRELRGNYAHFLPEKLNEEKETTRVYRSATEDTDADIPVAKPSAQIAEAIQAVVGSGSEKIQTDDNVGSRAKIRNESSEVAPGNKYPVSLSWLKEFKGN